eukprot:139986-Pyramimonas_sp.AAC.1
MVAQLLGIQCEGILDHLHAHLSLNGEGRFNRNKETINSSQSIVINSVVSRNWRTNLEHRRIIEELAPERLRAVGTACLRSPRLF